MILSKINLWLWPAIFLSTLTLSSSAQETPARWYEEGRAVGERNLSYRYANAEIPVAKNVILFLIQDHNGQVIIQKPKFQL